MYHPDIVNNLSLANVDLIIFCAEWCATCREFRTILEENALPLVPQFYWVDIENTILMPDDLDIENLPSIAIIKNQHITFWGVIEPRISHLKSLLIRQTQGKQLPIDAPLILSVYTQLKNRYLQLPTQ